ncbi:hypothetical protein [Litoribrevibacter albus]|uniref:Uncharacterized protein n=1 Tax=Litoribrevibacter albus TaxID=1473156 RepID=A0AA37SAX6_9GAMM|nr:hypothetical protein [Litoribrevibacter albus]GLQ31083.1 hypothetical protein GCM10007876_15620 [Litoribrevibacter albus]
MTQVQNSSATTERLKKTDTRSKTRKKLFTHVVESKDADDTLLRDMWRMRLKFLTLSIPEEEDYAIFKDYCTRPDTFLFTFRGEDNEMGAFFTFSFHPVNKPGHKALMIHSKYYYVDTPYRGHPKITSAAWPMMPKFIWRYGLRRIYFAAFTFPTSFVSLSRTFGRVYTIQGDLAQPWEKEMLEALAANLNGNNWDTNEKLICNMGVPQAEEKAASKGVTELRKEYERYNPNWRDGKSLPIMMRFDLATMKSVIGTSLRRNKRNKQ